MNRRIVLSDKEIVSGDFFRGLADLNFAKKDGLWVPPQDVATGRIAALEHNIVASPSLTELLGVPQRRHVANEEGDLVAQVQICTPDGRRLLVVGAPVTQSIMWVAHPDIPLVMPSGRELLSFQFVPTLS
jgi:hypothetical protein